MFNERKADACCYRCKDRKVTEDYNCHSHCPKYSAFKAELDFARENEQGRHKLYTMHKTAYLKKVGRKNNDV